MEGNVAIIVRWFDHNGAEVETRCFDELHAIRLEEGLTAEGLEHCRIRPYSRHDAPMDRQARDGVRVTSSL